jgi:hypothetical protein
MAEPTKRLLSGCFAGDIVYFSCERQGSLSGEAYVFGDGLGTESLTLHDELPDDFRSCLFRICLPLKYEAQRNLQRMIGDAESGTEMRTQLKSAQQLKQKQVESKKAREDEQNMENMLRQQGESFPMRYGQCIQLQHVVSKNFLTLIPRTAADFDQECMKVGLTSGDDGSLFVVQPQYKVRSEGAQVLYTDHILLENQRLMGGSGFLHYSMNSESDRHEINLSERSAQCRFRVQCYMNFQANSNSFMHLGGTVRVLHPETDSYLDASANQHLDSHQVYLKSASVYTPQVRSVFIVENVDKTKGGLLQWSQGGWAHSVVTFHTMHASLCLIATPSRT